MTRRTGRARRLTQSALTPASLLFALHGGCTIHAQQQQPSSVKGSESLVRRVEESGRSGCLKAGRRTRSLVVTPALGGGAWLVGATRPGRACVRSNCQRLCEDGRQVRAESVFVVNVRRRGSI